MLNLLLSILLLFIVGVGVFFYRLANSFAIPAPAVIPAPPSDLPVEAVTITTLRNTQLSGWFIPNPAQKGAVLLMHGVRSNRLKLVERARFLYQAGYSVLLFDFQAHGESAGEHITFGQFESEDAWSAFQYLQNRVPNQNIAVIGVSLGGASTLLSPIPQHADALILEAVYSRINTAIANRLEVRLGPMGRHLTPLLSWQIKPRLGFDPHVLTPIEHMHAIQAPVFIIAGAQDRHTLLSESEQMYALAPEPKQLWILPDAGHEDFHAKQPQVYEQKVLAFIAQAFATQAANNCVK